MVRKIGFTENVKPGDGAHEIVIHPKSAHRVVQRRIDAHGSFIGIFAGNLLIHVEQIRIFVDHPFFAVPLDHILEIQVYGHSGRTHAKAFVAHFLGPARSDIARDQIAE